MISQVIFRLSMIAATLAIALFSATPALANDIEKFGDYTPALDPINDKEKILPIATCSNGTNLMEVGDLKQNAILYYDKNGVLIKIINHMSGSGKAYLEGSPDKYVAGAGNWVLKMEFYDNNPIQMSVTGLPSKYVVPGYGIILHDAGKIIFDNDFSIIWEAGKHEWNHLEVDAVCDYLTHMP